MSLFISEYSVYLITSRKSAAQMNAHVTEVITGDKIHTSLNPLTIYIELLNTYEIYTKNPETGERGWNIEFVTSTDRLIKSYPDFDCVITKNDHAMSKCVEHFKDPNN